MPSFVCLILLPLAVSPVQALGVPLVLGIVAALAYYGFRHGLFLATLAGLHMLAATLVALGLVGPVDAWLELAEVPRQYAAGAAFLGVLLVALVGIRLAVGLVPADVVRLPPLLNQIGGGIMGGLAGLVAAGAVLLAFSFAPLPDAYKIDGSRLRALDMGSWLLRIYSRCLGFDQKTREVILAGEPGSKAADGMIKRPAWSEPFLDTDGSLTHEDGEPFVDVDESGTFTPEITANDANANGRRDVGLLEHYRLGHWLPLTAIQAPVLTGKDTEYVPDGAPVETIVYQASFADADPGDVVTYSLKPGLDDDAARVAIDPAKGTVTLHSPPNRATDKVYTFTVVATDKAGLAAEKTVKIFVTKASSTDGESSPGLTTQP